MVKFTVLVTIVLFNLTGYAQGVFLNEIRANDDGTDDAEFIELVGPAGFDMSGWQLAHINGSDSNTIFLFEFPAGTLIPDDGVTDIGGQNIGFIVIKRTGHSVANFDFEWGSTAMQNGPDGLLLSDDQGTRIQALTWNGSGILSGGDPAWRDIGNDPNSDNSLSAPDSLDEAFKKAWVPALATPGALNTNQTSGDISLPVQLSSFRAVPADRRVTLLWTTEAELNNIGFIIERSESNTSNYLQIATYESLAALAGSGNSSSRREYRFVDQAVFNGLTYWYRLIDVSANGVRTFHPALAATPQAPTPVEPPAGTGSDIKIPDRYRLEQNYPNPFNPETLIKFYIPGTHSQPGQITLTVFDLNGRLIRTLIDDRIGSGFFSVKWRGHDHQGVPVAGGIYLYVLKTEQAQLVKKMILLR